MTQYDEAKDIFLPEDYEIPNASTGYMKFKQGENKFRVLDSAVIGWEAWNEVDGSPVPVRKTMDDPFIVTELDDPDTLRHFWAFPIYNYQEERVQILEITQKGIMRSLKALVSDDDWGDPKQYDIVVTREGEGMETQYQTNPKPKKEIDKGILKFYKDLNINMQALFKGDDPFTKKEVNDKDLDEITEL